MCSHGHFPVTQIKLGAWPALTTLHKVIPNPATSAFYTKRNITIWAGRDEQERLCVSRMWHKARTEGSNPVCWVRGLRSDKNSCTTSSDRANRIGKECLHDTILIRSALHPTSVSTPAEWTATTQFSLPGPTVSSSKTIVTSSVVTPLHWESRISSIGTAGCQLRLRCDSGL